MQRELRKVIKKAYKKNQSDLGFLTALRVQLEFLIKRRPELALKALDLLDNAWFRFYLRPYRAFYVNKSYKSTNISA